MKTVSKNSRPAKVDDTKIKSNVGRFFTSTRLSSFFRSPFPNFFFFHGLEAASRSCVDLAQNIDTVFINPVLYTFLIFIII